MASYSKEKNGEKVREWEVVSYKVRKGYIFILIEEKNMYRGMW